jgi:hypothetical protein
MHGSRTGCRLQEKEQARLAARQALKEKKVRVPCKLRNEAKRPGGDSAANSGLYS